MGTNILPRQNIKDPVEQILGYGYFYTLHYMKSESNEITPEC